MLHDPWFWSWVAMALLFIGMTFNALSWRQTARRQLLPSSSSIADAVTIVRLRLVVRRLYYLYHNHESGQPGDMTLDDARQALKGTDFEIPEGE